MDRRLVAFINPLFYIGIVTAHNTPAIEHIRHCAVSETVWTEPHGIESIERVFHPVGFIKLIINIIIESLFIKVTKNRDVIPLSNLVLIRFGAELIIAALIHSREVVKPVLFHSKSQKHIACRDSLRTVARVRVDELHKIIYALCHRLDVKGYHKRTLGNRIFEFVIQKSRWVIGHVHCPSVFGIAQVRVWISADNVGEPELFLIGGKIVVFRKTAVVLRVLRLANLIGRVVSIDKTEIQKRERCAQRNQKTEQSFHKNHLWKMCFINRTFILSEIF